MRESVASAAGYKSVSRYRMDAMIFRLTSFKNSFPIPWHPPKALGPHDVGHSVVATGRGVLRLSSSISADVWTPAEN
ncbi:hypothetical protein ACQKNC_04330 [Lysinibacillus sp. NPDC094177]|uniref:hypothetical protein n=1 Tax=Lysinibacillus sp. NPDC094177 TaxID=3390580 RepID=UPI003D035780